MEAMGLDRQACLNAAKVDEGKLSYPKTRIHLDQLNDSFLRAARRLGQPNIGMEVGYRFRVHNFTKTGSVLAFCKTIADAAKTNMHYERLTETLGDGAFLRDDTGAYMVWDECFEDHDHYRHVTELIFAGYAVTTKWLSWSFEHSYEHLAFRHTAPSDMTGYDKVFGKNIDFGQSRNAIRFHPEAVDAPLPTSNPEKLASVTRRLDLLLDKMQRKSDLKAQVVSIIENGLAEDDVGFDYVAKQMSIKPHALRQMLDEAGHSFSQILLEVRQSLFHEHDKSGKSLAEIAQLLGYNDQSAFTRAFKKWYGVSPSEYKPD